MIYELREYVAVSGKEDALLKRFEDATLPLFARHGLQVRGLWVDESDTSRVVYLLEFEDKATSAAAWSAFKNDPEWQAAKAASEADGPIVAEMHSRTLLPRLAQSLVVEGEPA